MKPTPKVIAIVDRVPDLDKFLRRHLEYSSVLNPFGSGAYTHWTRAPVRFYVTWTLPEDGSVPGGPFRLL